MREYGGYMSFEEFDGEEMFQSLRMDSVRSALALTIECRKYRRIWLPYYLCDCMENLLKSIGISYKLYEIDEQFRPRVDSGSLDEDECLLLVNYYGQFANDEIKTIKGRIGSIFVDNTQSFFQPHIPGIDTANSCRKFFGLPDGSYFSTSIECVRSYAESCPYDNSAEKMLYIMGRYESSAGDYYDKFVENDNLPRGVPAKQMSRLVRNVLKGLNYEKIIATRTSNFDCLNNYLGEANKLCPKHKAGLFLYPFLHADGASIKRALIDSKIYAPTLWPTVKRYSAQIEVERDLADNLVLLPIDHRYDAADMDYIAKKVLSFLQ